jgi:hypothetical protein
MPSTVSSAPFRPWPRYASTVAVLLVLGRWDLTEAGVQASVVPPVDPAGGGVLDVDEGLQRGGC